MQQGMLYHHLRGEQPGVDVEQIGCCLHEELDLPAFTEAWRLLIARHPVLRTKFCWEEVDEPLQEVCREPDLPTEVRDLRGLAPERRSEEVAAYLQLDRERGFDLGTAPPVRLAILRTGDAEHQVVWSFHHILLDGRSFPIVLRELFELYDANRRGESLSLPDLPPYRDYIEWLGRQDFAAAESFWRRRLAGFQAPTHVHASQASEAAGVKAHRGEHELRLSKELTVSLRELAECHGFTLNTVLQGAWAVLLSRYAGEDDVVFGATRACRRSALEGAESMVGLFINTLPVRAAIDPRAPVASWLRELHEREREVSAYEHTPLVDVQGWSEVHSGRPLFESLVLFENYHLGPHLNRQGGSWTKREFQLLERTNYPLTLYAYGEPELLLKLAYDRPRFDDDGAARMLGHLVTLLEGMASDPAASLGTLPLLTPTERCQLLEEWNETSCDYPRDLPIHRLIEAQVDRTPEAVALVAGEERLTYRQLDERSNRLARHLRKLGLLPEGLVGLCVERSSELLVGVLAILKAGGAYVPLDPTYPRERLGMMIQDAEVGVLVTQSHLLDRLPTQEVRVVQLDANGSEIARESTERCEEGAEPSSLAYVIYTSGSTGRPKGVMVEHRNVANFFVGMDACIPHDPPGVWLAVTSLAFDISVLELLWTLARGFQVVLYSGERRRATRPARLGQQTTRVPEFSLLYFASDDGVPGDKYRLLLEGAKFADEHGFAAVWTPERHFHRFGGLYPNPAVTGAALATITKRVGIRAGSVVLPLHHPIRVAEDWALVDNLSGGRVGISFASGWQPDDFVLRPENHAEAREIMFREIETVRRLWRGESVAFPGPKGPVAVRTLPRPVQSELPVWVTSAGSVETYRRAGEIGANILTHLLGQTLAEVAERIRVYRTAWKESGHPSAGRVTLMLHTFVGDDLESVRETVRRPMTEYLRSSLSLIKNFAGAWSAFKKGADGTTNADVDPRELADEEMEDLLAYSFERYFETSALFGTAEGSLEMLEQLLETGVDEVACLIDFGVETATVLAHLSHLKRLCELVQTRPALAPEDSSLPELIDRHGVTHLQCTPSMARMLVFDPQGREALGSIRTLLIGGEALPSALARELSQLTSAEILNMYGPTETTVWSSSQRVADDGETVPIGRPIANTEFYVLDPHGKPVPVGVPGELFIGGEGVTRGYLNRPELTAERFVPNPARSEGSGRLYRTGDRVRYRADGALEFLGRTDHQVKIRGHRVELGEIEALIAGHEGVREAAVALREDEPGDERLVAYVAGRAGQAAAEADLRELLRSLLPEAMVPGTWIFLDRLPLTPNGKLDRKALPAPEVLRAPSAPTELEPRDVVEAEIARVWREILRVPEIGRSDNFFELGGHSLLALKAQRQLKQAFPNQELRIVDLFRFPTLGALGNHLREAETEDSLQQSDERARRRKEAMARREALRVRRSPRTRAKDVSE
jgi:natural product biosynthesis luciferase-like monooxygenase protein